MASRSIQPHAYSRRCARAVSVALLAAATGTLLSCTKDPDTRYPLRSTFWSDPDRRPFAQEPEEYESPFGWDAADQTIFRPLTRVFAVDPAGEATNVNAFDEVPDSSWFVNRIGRYALTPNQVAGAACTTPPLPTDQAWTVAGAKPNGANPGFMIKGPDGNRYMVKFDGLTQGARATAADVIVSRLYHAAGYHVPCNRIIHFDRSVLEIAPDATAEESGAEVPLRQTHIDKVLEKAIRRDDGRYRASVSLFVEGKPIGPWRYQDVRADDPNDVIRHEDRRELRGMRLLAAWVNHFDSREQNTLATYVTPQGEHGFVRHNVIDFGDCFGSIWEPPMLGKRIGHSNYLDVRHITEDFLSAGLVARPWDEARFGSSGDVFGYFDVEQFDPEQWQAGYPNPAFRRMSEHDGAWMARIIAAFDNASLRTTLESGQLDKSLEDELLRILQGRRQRILRRYLTRLSPLSFPEVIADGTLCMRDLALTSKLFSSEQRAYSAVGELDNGSSAPWPVRTYATGLCVQLPDLEKPSAPRYLRVNISSHSAGIPTNDARVHLYQLSTGDFRVVALQRLRHHSALN